MMISIFLEQMTKNQHNIVDFWRVGIKFSKKEMKAKLAGNTFYRTNSVLFGGINFAAKRVKNDYHEIQIPKDDLYSVNAKNSMVKFNLKFTEGFYIKIFKA